MPFYNTSDLDEYLIMYRETVGFIEMVMTENHDCEFLLLMDMNCNVYDMNHPYTL